MKKILILMAALLIAGTGRYMVQKHRAAKQAAGSNFASGNGRLEATDINIATKLAGRIEDIFVGEGDKVTAGQPLAQMQTNVLEAQLAQAEAKLKQAITSEASARTTISVKLSELEAARALVQEKESYLDGAAKRYERYTVLYHDNAASQQEFDDSETAFLAAKAALTSAQAGVKQRETEVEVAKANANGAAAAILAAEADIQRIQADIDDSLLTAPRSGRIQYRIAQPGEVLSAGGRVLNMVDLTDVSLTFFLPEEAAGRVRINAEVRLLFDALPGVPVPARVSYVASVAQFTPKTVETQSERQKLMFRVKAQLAPELLKEHEDVVKTGIPGVAWVQLDAAAEWPEFLRIKEEQ